jgi:pyruvate dehydrogenase E2 component (dihydrolipoamide acetyltransferase)
MSEPASAVEILMPRLSDTMEQGTILRWLLSEGDQVAVGAELVEIETDKASMTYESEWEGVLEIVVPEGETVSVGTPIARVGTGGTRPSAPPASRHPRPEPEPERSALSAAAPLPDEPALAPEVPLASHNNGSPPGASAVRATPLARRAALAHGVALDRLIGTGPHGRIVQADVLSAAGVALPAQRTPSERPRPLAPRAQRGGSTEEQSTSSAAKGGGRRIEPTRTQELIARRMAESKATIPHFQVQTEVTMDAAIALRVQLRGILDEPAPSLNDLVVKASALALRWHPRANSSYVEGGFLEHDRVNIGVAVAGEETLVVPVVQDADTRTLAQIGREVRRLAERVRAGEVTPPELSGATFTVSNLGMYGMTAIVPVINPGQAAILGVGAIRETLAREDGELVERSLMTLTLSCDHRILYGADASLFLGDIRSLLQAPLRLLV